jgi:hypothetical protein
MWKEENKTFQAWEEMWPKFSMDEAKHNYLLHMISNRPMTWGEEFKALSQQIKSKERLGIFLNGSIHTWVTQKKRSTLDFFETIFYI